MEWFYISLGIFGALLMGGIVLQRFLSTKIESALFDGLTKAQDNLIKTAAQELSGQKQEFRNEMDQRRIAIEKTIEKIEKDLRQKRPDFSISNTTDQNT
ncbi:MAG: hypothetical protein UZ21_OP11001000525 [Microgenomates bacterium OLB22]|nr:MAG: hypothetical protein UZ21_OP11001000525 [Microgenomates bacterium OLB22]